MDYIILLNETGSILLLMSFNSERDGMLLLPGWNGDSFFRSKRLQIWVAESGPISFSCDEKEKNSDLDLKPVKI